MLRKQPDGPIGYMILTPGLQDQYLRLNKTNKETFVRNLQSASSALDNLEKDAFKDGDIFFDALCGVIDALNEAQEKNQHDDEKIRCKSGCSDCCHMSVTVSYPEAKAIYAEAIKRNLDVTKFRHQMGLTQQTHAQVQSKNDRRCSFLNSENKCDVYSHRPLACRNYAVVSPPENCNTDIPQMVGIVSRPRQEFLISALWTKYETDTLANWMIRMADGSAAEAISV